MKEFKTIDQQIELLKERGLIIVDEEKAKIYLLTQNYYNIINGYARYFPRDGERYLNGVTFDEITHLYVFEKEVKQAVFQATLSMETHLKAIFSHRFAEAYPDTPYAYLNTHCYDQNKVLPAISTISNLARVIDRHKNRTDNSIAHYVHQYQNIPIWVLASFINFGDLRHMLTLSTTKVQNAVAKDMMLFLNQHIADADLFPPEVMLSFIENINDIRNICAHNNRLIGHSCRRDSKYWAPLHDKYGFTVDSRRRNLYSVLISLQCFLTTIEYGTVHNKIRKEANRLDRCLKAITASDILVRCGFPKDWHKNTPKIRYQYQNSTVPNPYQLY